MSMDDTRFRVRLAATRLVHRMAGCAYRLLGDPGTAESDEGQMPFQRMSPQEAPMWADRGS